jgi:brefeldin A-resistance guanine nucleotide exchange factor 1
MQVAHDLASTIAAEIQSLLQGAAAYIHNQQAWMSICALIKVIHLDPASYPVCLDTITWCVWGSGRAFTQPVCGRWLSCRSVCGGDWWQRHTSFPCRVVKESLSMLNYHTVVSTAVDLLERAVPDPRRGERPGHPNHIGQVRFAFVHCFWASPHDPTLRPLSCLRKALCGIGVVG